MDYLSQQAAKVAAERRRAAERKFAPKEVSTSERMKTYVGEVEKILTENDIPLDSKGADYIRENCSGSGLDAVKKGIRTAKVINHST
jgi:hypothetical protein